MMRGLHANILGPVLALLAGCFAATGCLAQSAAGGSLPQEGPTAASGLETGCEITQPPLQIVRACSTVLRDQPSNAAALAQRGQAWALLGDNASAFRDFNAAIAIDPNNGFALSRRAALQANGGNQAAVQADIDRINALAPRDASDFDARGIARALRRDHNGAIAEYSAGLKDNPIDPTLLVNRAASYMALRNVAAAMADYAKLAEAHPNYAFGHHVRGRALTEQKQFDQAAAAHDRAIQLDPDRPQFYVERGRTYLEQARSYLVIGSNQLRMALADLDKAIAMNPALAPAHYTRGVVHLELRDPDKAIADLSTAVALSRRFAPAYGVRGRALAQKGDHDRAIADYSKALELDPRYAESWYRRGASWNRKGEFDRALADLNEAIRLAPTVADAYAERADVRLRKNDLALAVEDATKAIELQPRLVPPYVSRAFAHSKLGDPERSLADYNKLVEILPDFADFYLRRAEVLEALGRQREADADRARAARLAGGQPAAANVQAPGGTTTQHPATFAAGETTAVMFKVAESQIKRGEYDLAIPELDKILIIQPSAWAAYALRGHAYSGKKEYTRALADVSKAIEINPGAAIAFAGRCYILLQTKTYERALADCTKGIEIGPAAPALYALRGSVYLALKAYQPAIADFDKAIGMGAPPSQAAFGRGLAHLYLKQLPEATDDFRKVLQAEPDHKGAALGLRLLTQPLSTTAPMKVEVVRHADPKCGDQCADWIAAQGRIDRSTPARFRTVLASLGNRRLPVFIDSLGGDLEASYEIGRMIRARDLAVYVTRTEPAPCPSTSEVCRKAKETGLRFALPRGKLASCASACTNVLASGAVRAVGPTALIGLHQAAYYSVQKDALALTPARKIPERVYVKMKDYLVQMGVDANLMLQIVATPHKDMYWLTRDELLASRLVNQAKSGEELVTGVESDDWIVTSPKAAQNMERLLREERK
ncbi:MAG: tetratricopeptide repeat protein [Hyphomicrobiaceae bacterium]|nr:tetratricopeptide repeat protein [Hyphomicrobiaceae bacterium]